MHLVLLIVGLPYHVCLHFYGPELQVVLQNHFSDQLTLVGQLL
jgi:hypothetical protein